MLVYLSSMFFRLLAPAILFFFGVLIIMAGLLRPKRRKPYWQATVFIGFLLVLLALDQIRGWSVLEALLRFFFGS
jgi:predicted transcriptional regulator